MKQSFTWTNFDGDFLSSVVYSAATKDDVKPSIITDDVDLLTASMNQIAEMPTAEFVMTYRYEIESKFLKKFPQLICEISGKRKKANHYALLNELTKKTLGIGLITQYQKALHKVGIGDLWADMFSEFAVPRTADLQTSTAEEIPLYDFQKEAVVKLEEGLLQQDQPSGLLVMPTGSGKTRTAVYFLLRRMISQGYQVVWLTHRHMLIDQTADAFYSFCPVIKLDNPKAKKFKIACVSGHHASIKATEKDDDVMILSVQSVCRNLPYLKSALAKKVIIVVDEAHHAVARSYQNTIHHIRKFRKDAKLLGLTATPVRGSDSESAYLNRFFDDNILYSISMSKLMTRGVLADPVFEHIQTGENFEAVISLDEAKFIKQWGELPDTLITKVVRSTKRNQLIINQYMDNKERYGKTLLFAMNGEHAYTLCHDLKKLGVKSEFIYANLGRANNARKIRQFQDGKLDVLININILTEGSDIPDIETVMLTRPTNSEVLLMQMIGRGLRGTAAGGTEKAHIVDFCDQWDTFTKWLNPEWVLGGEMTAPLEREPVTDRTTYSIPWEMIRDIYQSISWQDGKVQPITAMPYGWYSLLDGDKDYHMIIFEDQFDGFKNIIKDKNQILKDSKITAGKLLQHYFGGFVMPPRIRDLEIFLENMRDSGESPHLFAFEGRHLVDPVKVAHRIQEEKLDLFKYAATLYEDHSIIENLYGSLEDYRSSIFEIINRDIHNQGCKVDEMPHNMIPFEIDQPYDLDELVKEVKEEMFEGVYEGIDSVTWTDKPAKVYFGICYDGSTIRINKMLNSSQVPREVVKYIVYHEMLHRDYHYHDKTFRREEHKYPNYTEHERFLDYKWGKFAFEW